MRNMINSYLFSAEGYTERKKEGSSEIRAFELSCSFKTSGAVVSMAGPGSRIDVANGHVSASNVRKSPERPMAIGETENPAPNKSAIEKPVTISSGPQRAWPEQLKHRFQQFIRQRLHTAFSGSPCEPAFSSIELQATST